MSLTLLRRAQGLTVKEIASKMGIHYSYYSHLENGRRKFSPELIERLALALDVNRTLVEKEVSELQNRTFTVPNWITTIRLNGISSLKAYENHLKLNPPSGESFDIKYAFAQFVQQNIAMSILAEFDANPELESMLRYRLRLR